MKTSIDRIMYYTRKAAQFSKTPLSQRKPGSLRFKRLMAYKAAMNERIKDATV